MLWLMWTSPTLSPPEPKTILFCVNNLYKLCTICITHLFCQSKAVFVYMGIRTSGYVFPGVLHTELYTVGSFVYWVDVAPNPFRQSLRHLALALAFPDLPPPYVSQRRADTFNKTTVVDCWHLWLFSEPRSGHFCRKLEHRTRKTQSMGPAAVCGVVLIEIHL